MWIQQVSSIALRRPADLETLLMISAPGKAPIENRETIIDQIQVSLSQTSLLFRCNPRPAWILAEGEFTLPLFHPNANTHMRAQLTAAMSLPVTDASISSSAPPGASF